MRKLISSLSHSACDASLCSPSRLTYLTFLRSNKFGGDQLTIPRKKGVPVPDAEQVACRGMALQTWHQFQAHDFIVSCLGQGSQNTPLPLSLYKLFRTYCSILLLTNQSSLTDVQLLILQTVGNFSAVPDPTCSSIPHVHSKWKPQGRLKGELLSWLSMESLLKNNHNYLTVLVTLTRIAIVNTQLKLENTVVSGLTLAPYQLP